MRLFSRGGVDLCAEPVTYNPLDNGRIRPLDAYYPAGNPFGSVDIRRDVGSSAYHALGLSLERRMTKGFSFQSRYTWSHSMTTVRSEAENPMAPRMSIAWNATKVPVFMIFATMSR